MKRLFQFFQKRPSESPTVLQEPLLLSYRLGTLQGVGRRRQQEDAYGWLHASDVISIKEKGLLAMVADGMGGMMDGQAASATAISSLTAQFQTLQYDEDIPEQLCQMVHNASAAVYEIVHGYGGTTLVLCFFYEEKLYFASVGDSYLYLKRGGQLYRLNREHNVRARLLMESVQDKTMDPGCTEGNKELAAVTRFLGMEELPEVDCFRIPYPLEEGDVILLCSDGVAGVMEEESLLQCLNEKTAPLMCQAMDNVIQSKALPYQDNYTALVIQCGY